MTPENRPGKININRFRPEVRPVVVFLRDPRKVAPPPSPQKKVEGRQKMLAEAERLRARQGQS